MAPGTRFAALALVLALAIVVAGNLVMTRWLDQRLSAKDWLVSLVTALVVGGFLALLVFGRQVEKTEPEGGPAGETAEAARPPSEGDARTPTSGGFEVRYLVDEDGPDGGGSEIGTDGGGGDRPDPTGPGRGPDGA